MCPEGVRNIHHPLRTLLIFSLIIAVPSIAVANKNLDPKEQLAQEYRLSGYEAQEKGDLDTALTLYIKAAELGEESAPIYNDIGVIYEQIGLDEKAEESYLKALKFDNAYLPIYSNLAYFYKKRGDYNKSAEYFKKRIELGDPQDEWTTKAKEELSNLAVKLPRLRRWLTEQEVTELNKELTRQAQEEFYDRVLDAQRRYKQAMALEKEEKFEEALDEYNKALLMTPESPKITSAKNRLILKMTKQELKEHTDMAMKLLESGDTASASMEFHRALSILPKEPISISE